MKRISKTIDCKSRNDVFSIYPIGDVHIGCRGCAEGKFKKIIAEIQNNPLAYWIGGGDYIEAIKPTKPAPDPRFDVTNLPDWMLEGDASNVRERLTDITAQEAARFRDLVKPISNKCLGLIEGNHEYQLKNKSNTNVISWLCEMLKVDDLTDEAGVRLIFSRGGGRSEGAEPTKLAKVRDEWECADIIFRGHTHTPMVLPPKAVPYVPRSGNMQTDEWVRHRWSANWGCWVYSRKEGPSTYVSRQGFPWRPMMTIKAEIKPFPSSDKDPFLPKIEIRSYLL